ncbi:helix-turn-helix transcriptional regulator [Roseiterribacter gracilis]|uniref:AraC family transcriptional regulator n=1 Tax=Roseiterribacter gracilis TaxID=2812848 RepID=A0A8S8XHX6_9PROT|nr:AraC family transcriptional regulator [Rhodospirillales bacterium TMPK1]
MQATTLNVGRESNLGVVATRREFSGAKLVRQRYAPRTNLPKHRHDNSYLCIVLDGSYDEHVAGNTYAARAGSVFVHPAGETHADQFGHAGGTCLDLHFESGFGGWRRIAASPRQANLPALAASFARELAAQDRIAAFALEALTHEVLGILADAQAGALGASWVARVRAAMNDDPARDWTLADLAAIASVHPIHVARQFRRDTGRSVQAHLRERRLLHAASRLAAGEAPADVAAACGYYDQAHLNRAVRARLHTTPARLRRSGRTFA